MTSRANPEHDSRRLVRAFGYRMPRELGTCTDRATIFIASLWLYARRGGRPARDHSPSAWVSVGRASSLTNRSGLATQAYHPVGMRPHTGKGTQ